MLGASLNRFPMIAMEEHLRWSNWLVVFGPIVGIGTLSYSGFCFGTFQFLSDDDAINAAIDDVTPLSVHVVESTRGGYITFSPEKPVRYDSRDEFRRLNPDCCKAVPHDRFLIGYWHQLFGLAAKSVRVNYMVRWTNDTGGVSQMEAIAERAISNCGQVLNTGH